MTRTITTRNPATGAAIETFERMDPDTARATVGRCHNAFRDWRLKPLSERAEVIRAIGATLRADREAFAQLMTREVGKLIGDSRGEIDLCAAICDFTADNGPDVLADETRTIPGGRGVISYQPLGVIYGIQPWNFPAYQAVRYAVACLMAGNGVLLKHAENCTGSALFLREVMARAGLPEDLFAVLVIDHDTSDAIIADPRVRGVTLTGSDAAGRLVAQKAAAEVKKTVLELGSNDAYIVLSDADMDTALDACLTGRLFNNGQTCVNAKRFIVHKDHYDTFVDRYTRRMRDTAMGDPADEDTELGPMAREDLRDTLHHQVRDSVQAGARVLCGGTVPDRAGAFYPATVLVDVAPGQPAYDDELFGPVASIIRAEDDDHAMRLANDSRYGLGGGIFSADTDRARDLARLHFDTGMVSINSFNVAIPNMPFGGGKASGHGREHGGFGMREFVNAKSIYMA